MALDVIFVWWVILLFCHIFNHARLSQTTLSYRSSVSLCHFCSFITSTETSAIVVDAVALHVFVWVINFILLFCYLDQPCSPCGCGDLSVRLGSRISPHHHRVVVEVHWRRAQGWRSISWVVATFNHVSGSFNLSMAATRDVWIIPSFQIWGYVLHVEHISCVITNCGQLQWAIPSLFSIALYALLEKNITRKLLSLSLDLFFKILLFQVTFLIFFSTAIFFPYFLQVGLLLQYVALFQSGI